MNRNPTTDVPLRRRSSPYEFVVSLKHDGYSLCLYSGRSYQYALSAYWQAVKTCRFVGLPGQVLMELTENRTPYGGFLTELETGGKAKSLHMPSGRCSEWADAGWSPGDNLVRTLIATIPGMLGPFRHST
jgi:hypothetical protein